MPILNGESAKVAIKGAIALLITLIIAITVIIINGKPVPVEFSGLITLLAGFIIGTRVITDNAIEEAKAKIITKKENKSAS